MLPCDSSIWQDSPIGNSFVSKAKRNKTLWDNVGFAGGDEAYQEEGSRISVCVCVCVCVCITLWYVSRGVNLSWVCFLFLFFYNEFIYLFTKLWMMTLTAPIPDPASPCLWNSLKELWEGSCLHCYPACYTWIYSNTIHPHVCNASPNESH